jgi:predicted DNA-binding protein (MmcQ/YjbR family)
MTTRKRMDVDAVKAHCAALPGATSKLFEPPMNVLSYKVGGKTFAYFKTSEPERWRFSVRVTPERFLELTSVPGMKPARFMARYHWVTIVDVRSVPPDYLRELIAWSYEHALGGLSKRTRASIISG